MGVSNDAPDILHAHIPPSTNRFQPLDGLLHDEEPAKSKFHAQGVYKPPHIRTPSECTASTMETDPVANYTSVIGPGHGPSLDHEGKTISRPRSQHTNSVPATAVFGFEEVKKKIHEEITTVRTAIGELEMMEKEFLEEGARFEREVQALRNAGFADEDIREIISWPQFPSRPPSTKPLDVDVSVFRNFRVGKGGLPGVRQTVAKDLARVGLDSDRAVERPARAREMKRVQQTEEDLVNRTPIPGGPIYSSANVPGDVHQTGKYGIATPITTSANDTQADTPMHQAMTPNERVQAYPVILNRHGSTPGAHQAPGHIYQTAPVTRFNSCMDALPPRFRKPQLPAIQQPAPLHFQNVVRSGPGDPVQTGRPATSLPVLGQPIPNSFRPISNPPPPRPFYYEADLAFDFEGVALSSNCNRDVFVKTYWKTNGFSPSHAAWVSWSSAVERIEGAKRAQLQEYQKAMEREAKERRGARSRLMKWSSGLMDDPSGPEPGYSSDTSTKVASSSSSEAGDEGNIVTSIVLPRGNWRVEVPPALKRWKDVTDKTWAFGEPPRSDDPEHYMTHVVEKTGWQIRDPRPE